MQGGEWRGGGKPASYMTPGLGYVYNTVRGREIRRANVIMGWETNSGKMEEENRKRKKATAVLTQYIYTL